MYQNSVTDKTSDSLRLIYCDVFQRLLPLEPLYKSGRTRCTDGALEKRRCATMSKIDMAAVTVLELEMTSLPLGYLMEFDAECNLIVYQVVMPM